MERGTVYDLEKDPNESRNVYDKQSPEVIDYMKGKIRNILREVDVKANFRRPKISTPAVFQKRNRKLRASFHTGWCTPE